MMIEREADQSRGERKSPRPLTPGVVEARIVLRVAELRVLAAWTSVVAGRSRGKPYRTTTILSDGNGGMIPRFPREVSDRVGSKSVFAVISAADSRTARGLVNHLVGGGKQSTRHRQTERSSSFDVDE